VGEPAPGEVVPYPVVGVQLVVVVGHRESVGEGDGVGELDPEAESEMLGVIVTVPLPVPVRELVAVSVADPVMEGVAVGESVEVRDGLGVGEGVTVPLGLGVGEGLGAHTILTEPGHPLLYICPELLATAGLESAKRTTLDASPQVERKETLATLLPPPPGKALQLAV